MKQLLKRGMTSWLCFIIILFLTACGHKNPLLNEQTIARYKANFFIESADYPIKECADFYADRVGKNNTLQQRCDQWSSQEYQNALAVGNLPYKTTLADFRDPTFWKAVKPQ
jgi:hypothetical protein